MADSMGSAPVPFSERPDDLENRDHEVSLSDLEKFTNNFSDLIGGTTVGFVWKGVYRDGREIAVKKLDQEKSPLARDKEFRNKVQQHIMALKHDNIVEMVAFCRDEKEIGDGAELVQSFICCVFSPKGSLDQYIFATDTNPNEFPKKTDTNPNGIVWDTRFKIIEGICHGLRYLHTQDMPVLHMDLKPKTIFLDDNMSPKIADFGLARIFGKDETRVVEKTIVGTYGYLAPEYAYNGEFSTRSDIYSLGILILEITTAEQNHIDKTDGSARKYIDKIRREWTEEHITSRYPKLGSDRLQEVKVCIRVGLECVDIEPTRRPSIDTIVEKLNATRTAS